MENENESEETKDVMVEGTKENNELMKFVKSLSKQEIERIKEIREFKTIPPGTLSYKVAVLNDTLRQAFRACRVKLDHKLQSILELHNNINRLNKQVMSGSITEQINEGLVATEDEVKSLIRKNKLTMYGEFCAIPKVLGELRMLVGELDISGKVMLSMEKFDEMVEQTEKQLKEEFGFDLFGELE